MPKPLMRSNTMLLLTALKRGMTGRDLKKLLGIASDTTLYRRLDALKELGVEVEYSREGGGNQGSFKATDWGCVNRHKL